MSWLSPVTLSDDKVRLELTSLSDEQDLIEAASDGKLWDLWYTMVPKPEGMKAEIERRLDLYNEGSMLPLTIIDQATDKAVGMTTFMNASEANRRVEIGNTWNGKSAQGSGLNRRSKLLMLTHAFENWNCIAVELRTHFLNRQSRTAIERLGAKLDGILRNHMIMPDGTLRDTCVYSIIESEWPTIKTHLAFQVSRF